MNADSASVVTGSEQASCGGEFGGCNFGRRKIAVSTVPGRRIKHVHKNGTPGCGKTKLLERMLL
jgi:hypothetical protein